MKLRDSINELTDSLEICKSELKSENIKDDKKIKETPNPLEKVKPIEKIEGSLCKDNISCKEDHRFKVTITSFTKRGKIVNVSIEVENISDRKLSANFTHGKLTNTSGAQVGTDYDPWGEVYLSIGKKYSVNYHFYFKEEINGNTFDLSLKCTKTKSSFTFSSAVPFNK